MDSSIELRPLRRTERYLNLVDACKRASIDPPRDKQLVGTTKQCPKLIGGRQKPDQHAKSECSEVLSPLTNLVNNAASQPEHEDSIETKNSQETTVPINATLAARATNLDNLRGRRDYREFVSNPCISCPALAFLPRKTHDTAFGSLWMMTVTISPTSAIPIAKIIRDKYNDEELCELIGTAKKATAEHWRQRGKLRTTLTAEIEKARDILATRLRDTGMSDLTVRYVDRPLWFARFVNDKRRIESNVSGTTRFIELAKLTMPSREGERIIKSKKRWIARSECV